MWKNGKLEDFHKRDSPCFGPFLGETVFLMWNDRESVLVELEIENQFQRES